MMLGFTQYSNNQPNFSDSCASSRNSTEIDSAGFSLVELLLYLSLFSILILIILEIFITTLEIETRVWSDSVTAQDGQYVLTRIAYDIRRAEQIIQPADFGAAGSELRLEIEGQELVYEVVGDELILTDGGGSYHLLSSGTDVNGLSFTKIGSPQELESIEIDFQIGSPDEQLWGESRQYKTTVGMRE